MGKTKIEWATDTWNPVTGCTKVSVGCANCYAERHAERFWGTRQFGNVVCHEDRLDEPLHWRKPRRVFVCSMGDLFHEDVPDEFIKRIWDVASKASQHTFMILTKRPARMLEFAHISIAEWPRNVWLGVTAENQATADERIPLLLKTPAAVRFVSVEPMLGPVDFTRLNDGYNTAIEQLDWLICGGESGLGARPMHPDWALSLRDQCVQAEVPFFFKQWGEFESLGPERNAKGLPRFEALRGIATKHHLVLDGEAYLRVGKKDAGNLLDGERWEQFPKEET